MRIARGWVAHFLSLAPVEHGANALARYGARQERGVLGGSATSLVDIRTSRGLEPGASGETGGTDKAACGGTPARVNDARPALNWTSGQTQRVLAEPRCFPTPWAGQIYKATTTFVHSSVFWSTPCIHAQTGMMRTVPQLCFAPEQVPTVHTAGHHAQDIIFTKHM